MKKYSCLPCIALHYCIAIAFYCTIAYIALPLHCIALLHCICSLVLFLFLVGTTTLLPTLPTLQYHLATLWMITRRLS